MGLTEQQMLALRRKLDALGYTDPLDPISGPLVQKLVDDLIHCTESLRSLKLASARQAQELGSHNEKLEALKQDSQRLQGENAQLHVLLIKANETNDKHDKDAYQQVKKLEDRIAELSFWKSTALEKMQTVDQENQRLKARVDELVRLTDQLTAGAIDPQAAAAKISINSPPKPSSQLPRSAPLGASVDLVQAANTRIQALTRQLADKDAQLESLRQQVSLSQEAIARREHQIGRLGARAGADVDAIALASRNEANENMILQLNSTVDTLAAQVRELEGAARDKKRLELSLAAADRLRSEAEDKLRRAVKENEVIQHEVLQLRADIAMMQATNSQANALAASEVDTALSSVSGLRARLADSRAEQERLKALLESMSGERSAALAQVSALQREIETLKALLEDMTARADEHRSHLLSTRNDHSLVTERLVARESALEEAQCKLAALTGELDAKKRALDRSEAERQVALAGVEQLQQRLDGVEHSATNEHSTNLQLATKLAKTESELRATQASLATADAESQTLRKQLREANEVRVKAQGSLATVEEEKARLSREVNTTSQQLSEERANVEQLMVTRTELEVESGRLKAQVSMLTSEKSMLEERLAATTHTLNQGQSNWSTAQRELAQLQGLPARFEDVQEQLRISVVRLAGVESDLARVRSEAQRYADQLQRAEVEIGDLRRLLDSEREMGSALRAQLNEAQQAIVTAESSTRAVESDREQLLAEHRAVVADLGALRDALSAEGAAAKEADAGARTLQTRLAGVQRQLALKEEEATRLQSMLTAAQAAADSARGREEEARASGRELAERSRKAETLAAEYEADIGQLRVAREGAQQHIQQLEAAVGQLRGELEARRQEVEQLTTLSLRGDATVQEYMANLKAMSADLRAADMRVADLVNELAAREDALARVNAESQDLRRVVNALDGERDSLQNELDNKAEHIAALGEQVETLRAQLSETQRLLAMAEGRLSHADARARDGDSEVSVTRAQLNSTLEQLHAVVSERDMMRAELRAVSEDLEALVKENQVVSSELALALQQRDTQAGELRRLGARATSAEQMVRAKEAEVEDLRRVYEALALENRRLQSTITQLEKEATAREAALAQRADEAAHLSEASRDAQAHINQYIMDLQAFERQVDALSRELAKRQGEVEDAGREREVLLEELRAAQQVRLGLERHREELQRQVAALDSQLAVSRARLEDAGSEASSLGQRLALERNRVAELEALLAGMRAREYKHDLVSKHGGDQMSIMQERNRILEEQVTTLQHQVTALQKSRDVQDREMARLRTEALALAAAAADDGDGADREQAAELGARVLELEQRIATLQAELSAARSGAREAADTAVAARREASSLRAENERLLALSGSLDAEARSALKAGLNGKAVGAAAEEQVSRLQAQLKEEQSRRRQAERDFLELMTSIEEGDGGGSAGGDSLASKRLSELQVKVEGLESEKASLEENVAKTRSLMVAMQAELQRIHVEYGGASSTLHALLGGSTLGGASPGPGAGGRGGSVLSSTPTHSHRR